MNIKLIGICAAVGVVIAVVALSLFLYFYSVPMERPAPDYSKPAPKYAEDNNWWSFF